MSPTRRDSIEMLTVEHVYSPTLSHEPQGRPKKWYHLFPLVLTVLLILAPHPSFLYILIHYHWKILHRIDLFILHLLTIFALTFLIFSSLIVCANRDPGPVNIDKLSGNADDEQEGITEALMSDFDFSAPGRWCRKCWAPKPERTHHCSHCGRCVLKQDHHCPWIGNQCVGHRTYPAFIHFLGCITLYSIYIAGVCISGIWWAFHNSRAIDEATPIHEISLAFAGIISAFVIGSFFVYHLYLVTTNQTTIENVSPFLILRDLPPLPQGDHGLSDPPLEPELSYNQRYVVRRAHQYIRLYDVGWKRNWQQVFGWNRPRGWICRVFYGGASNGDGHSYPRNPRTDAMLARLANELVNADKDQ